MQSRLEEFHQQAGSEDYKQAKTMTMLTRCWIPFGKISHEAGELGIYIFILSKLRAELYNYISMFDADLFSEETTAQGKSNAHTHSRPLSTPSSRGCLLVGGPAPYVKRKGCYYWFSCTLFWVTKIASFCLFHTNRSLQHSTLKCCISNNVVLLVLCIW